MSKQVTHDGVVFLHHAENYEVRKNKTGVIKYYTRMDTGESGMSQRGLANGCGVGDKALRKLIDETTIFQWARTKQSEYGDKQFNLNKKEVRTKSDIYLILAPELHVILDIYCERVIYYYAFESRYKKAKARELYQALAQHGLRTFIQSKTGYQATQAQQHDASISISIEEQLTREVEELRLQLVQKDEQLVQKDEQLAAQETEIQELKYKPVLEKTYQAYIHDMIGGERELYLLGPYPGRIDIMTPQMVVEIKRATHFEQAFGQLLRYRAKLKETEHAGKTYVIYLFGDVRDDERRVLNAMAEMTNFQLIIEKEIKDYMDEDELKMRDKLKIVPNNDIA